MLSMGRVSLLAVSTSRKLRFGGGDARSASINPDSLIPSRIADFVTQYITQQTTTKAIASESIPQKASCCICALKAFMFMGPSFVGGQS